MATAPHRTRVLAVSADWRASLALLADGNEQTAEQIIELFNAALVQLLALAEKNELSSADYLAANSTIHLFRLVVGSCAVPLMRKLSLSLVPISCWANLSHRDKIQSLVESQPLLGKLWKQTMKRLSTATGVEKEQLIREKDLATTLVRLLTTTLYSITIDTVDKIDKDNEHDKDKVRENFCMRILELLVDLETQLATRRFLHALLQDHHTVLLCEQSPLVQQLRQNQTRQNSSELLRMLDLLHFYTTFNVDEMTGQSLTEEDQQQYLETKVSQFQRMAFINYRDWLGELSLEAVGKVCDSNWLRPFLLRLSTDQLHTMCTALFLRTQHLNGVTYSYELMVNVLLYHFTSKLSSLRAISALPLYPTETILFDIPYVANSGDSLLVTQTDDNLPSPLAIPRLGLQYLSVQDYLYRIFVLYQLESAYEISQDIQDAVARLSPRWDYGLGATSFSGWARMAVPVEQFTVTEVGKHSTLENTPAFVRGEIVFNVDKYTRDIQNEWDSLKPFEVVFLVSITVHPSSNDTGRNSRDRVDIQYVRGCEIREVLGFDGKPLRNDQSQRLELIREPYKRSIRMLRVSLDPVQFQNDTDRLHAKKLEDPYTTFNILIRRKSQENNFKAVLQTIKTLVQDNIEIPQWLHSVFLGYGEPISVTYKGIKTQTIANKVEGINDTHGNEHEAYKDDAINFQSTFVDRQHLIESFPGKEITFEEDDIENGFHMATFTMTTQPMNKKRTKSDSLKDKKKTKGKGARKSKVIEQPDVDLEETHSQHEVVYVHTYRPNYNTALLQSNAERQLVRFTPMQVEAIRSGCSPGLSLIVGPPGTGKTDVAVQIISNLYRNFPKQRILLVTHSNQALNQLCEKIAQLDINPLHLLRLGQGEGGLDLANGSFSKHGRVQSYLERRQELLAKVDAIVKSLGVLGEHARDCETAGYFYLYHVRSRWELFIKEVERLRDLGDDAKLNVFIKRDTPFLSLMNAHGCSFNASDDTEQLLQTTKDFWKYLEDLFDDINRLKVFETLKNSAAKSDYLLTKEACIVAMTCTYAALKRHDLIKSGFTYNTLIMEEAAQVLEIEAFIPMTLQTNMSMQKLNRIVLLGDHHQLPPIVQNRVISQQANMEQSLFARMIQLGVPYVQLDKQGRARRSIAELYSWRYSSLGHLARIDESAEYKAANAGFAHVCQIINVPDYKGKGEIEPVPHFYQNLGEAEYVVAVYQYMRLLGYPAASIAILTMYNGQRALVWDVLKTRCESNRLFGLPGNVSTVDKYQGRQSDYVLLSLVRTKHAGHVRDLRRLTVAVSRARLGLYVFCRQNLFNQESALREIFQRLERVPNKLQLVENEAYQCQRKFDAHPSDVMEMESVLEMGAYVYRLTEQRLAQLQIQQETFSESMEE